MITRWRAGAFRLKMRANAERLNAPGRRAFPCNGATRSVACGGLRQAIALDLRRAYGPSLKQLGDVIEMSAGASNRRTERRYIVAVGHWRLRARSDKAARPPSLSTAKDF